MRDIGDIVKDVPGVNVTVSKTGATTIQMRGMSSAYTLILVDGKRINMNQNFDGNGFDSTSGFFPPPALIDRVEVIRGPASLIYGSDAMGGVINIITKKIPDKITASVGVDTNLQEHHGQWGNSYGINGMVAAPINESFSYNFRAKYQYGEQNNLKKNKYPAFPNIWTTTDRQGNTVPITYTDRNENNPYSTWSPTGYLNWSVGGRLNWLADDKNTFYVDTDYNYQRLGSLNTSSNQNTAIREYHKFNTSLNHEGEYEIGKFTSYLQYANTRKLPHEDLSKSNVSSSSWGTNGIDYGATKGDPNHQKLVENQIIVFSSSWVNSYDFDKYGSLILNAGPYYMYETFFNRCSTTSQTGECIRYKNEQSLAAAFIEGEYLINDYVSTTLGARYNWAEKYNSSLDPRFYVNVYPTSWLTLKAGVTSGIKYPSLSYVYSGYTERRTANTYIFGNENLDPEQSLNYELSAILDTNLGFLSITGFYTDFKDKINTTNYYGDATLCNNNNCTIYENVDKAEISGLELSLSTRPLFKSVVPGDLLFDLAYTLTETEQKSGQYEGRDLNSVPRHTIVAKLSHKIAGFDSYIKYTGRLKTNTQTSFLWEDNGEVKKMRGGIDYYKDIHTVDLGTNYKFKNGVTLGATINNLFDKDYEKYFPYVNESRGSAAYDSEYQTMYPRRSFWLTLRADF